MGEWEMNKLQKEKREVCPGCGNNRRAARKQYRFDESGVPNVSLCGIDVIECPNCGDSPIIPNLNGLMRTLTLAIVQKPARLSGQEIRYLRKRVNKTGLEFSKLLHVDNSTLSKWENNDDPVGDQSDRLIRLLTMALDPELSKKLKEAAESFSKAWRKPPAKAGIEIDLPELSYQYA